jgi:phosphoglycerate dehydrogenase-like enzyme
VHKYIAATAAWMLLCSFQALAETRKIVVLGMPPEHIADLQSVSPDARIVSADEASLPGEAADADAIFGTISPEILHLARKLKWVQIYSAGVENYLFPEFQSSGVVLTNCKILMGPEIADHAFALLLSLTRELNRIIPTRPSEEWQRSGFHPVELRGKTAVIVGVGGIGSQIAQRAHAFGMTVIGVDPKDMPLNPYVSRMVYPEQIDTVLPLADVVFISAPHTPKSEGMIGPSQFELMKKGAYFIAVSRGKVYNTDALVKALDSRRLAGAGLDVTNPEPLPKGHALWKFDNVVITPHIAGQSDNVNTRQMELFKENIAHFVKGEQLVNVVDKQKGY